MTLKQSFRCPHCRAEISDLGQVSRCPHCCETIPVNNSLPAIFSDPTEYSVNIIEHDKANRDHIRTISSLMQTSVLKAKLDLSNLPLEVFRGEAYKIIDVSDVLEASGIKYTILPSFPWQKGDKKGIVTYK